MFSFGERVNPAFFNREKAVEMQLISCGPSERPVELYAPVKSSNYVPFGALSGRLKVGTVVESQRNLTAF